MKKALVFVINNYPGSDNDLRGCINDANNFKKTILDPLGFIVTTFTNSQVTKNSFYKEIEKLLEDATKGDELIIQYSGHGTQVIDRSGDESDLYDEALYLYDGPIIDDTLSILLSNLKDDIKLTLVMDCCFAESNTRIKKEIKDRFKLFEDSIPVKKRKKLKRRKRFLRNNDLKYTIYWACSEDQTSADAFIGGKWNGAFTYYLCKAFTFGMTNKELANAISKYLPSNQYDQIPVLGGNVELFALPAFGGTEIKKKCCLNFLKMKKSKVKRSKLLSLGTRDLIKGGVLSAIVAVLSAVYEVLQSGGFQDIDWKKVVVAAVTALLAYFVKNLATNSEDQLLTKEPSNK